MIFKEYNQTDIINIKNQIDRLRACGIGVADLPQNLRDSVWKIVYCELKQNGSRQNTVSKAVDGVCQSNILKKMFGLPKDVFGKKYWNMYSPDSKIRQEKYSNVQLPFNYAQVECNSVYRAMIHHMITGADVPTDTVVDIFGKFGLAAALCAGGYKYKIVCLNEQNFYLYSLLQDVMRKPVKFYKMIDESDEKIENPEIMIFQIIELVSSTAYSAIINKEPVDIETLKPYLYQTIRTIIINHQSGDEKYLPKFGI